MIYEGAAEHLVERMLSWETSKDHHPDNLLRALELLAKAWDLAAMSFGGQLVIGQLFSWAALAAAMHQFVGLVPRLLEVQDCIAQGYLRIQAAAPAQQAVAAARVWSSVLFLLDGPGEPWWWLGLIRNAAQFSPPWIESDDGGVGAFEQSQQGPLEGARGIKLLSSAEDDESEQCPNEVGTLPTSSTAGEKLSASRRATILKLAAGLSRSGTKAFGDHGIVSFSLTMARPTSN